METPSPAQPVAKKGFLSSFFSSRGEKDEHGHKKEDIKALLAWEKSIMEGEHKLVLQAKETKEECIKAILMFNAVFAIEDEDGKEYTQERMLSMSHHELIELLEFFVSEMKKDVGAPA